ncbi:MAG TPA: hypothetical protein VJK29_03430 [Terriglobales bacterium]|nr:hypothetical protein [Terriglobales bacterium]
METSKLKAKIGPHEFEAEGPTELVQSQFQAWKELVATFPQHIVAPVAPTVQEPAENKDDPNKLPHIPLEGIMHVDGRVVSLTAVPATPQDAALLVLLGQKDLRNNHSSTGQEIGDGLAQSGQPVERVDRILDKAIQEALVMKIGRGRSTRYRLTNQGLHKALSIARDLLAQLP